MANKPVAYLFANGNAAFFDENRQQIAEMQAKGWCGLHDFMAAYPDGIVKLQSGDPVHPDLVPCILQCLRNKPTILKGCVDGKKRQ